MSKYYIYKLKNIDLHERVKRFPPDFKFDFDFAYLVMHIILKQMALRIEKEKDFNVYKTFNPLSSTVLQSLHRKYNEHIRYLGENFPSIGNIFERMNYSEGRSYSYRFRKYYHYQQLELYELKNLTLLKKLKAQDSLKLSDSVTKNCSFLVGYFNRNRLTIKLQEALDFNSDELEKEGNIKKYLSNAFKILNIQNGKYYMTNKPETDGRFHSNITGFSKKFRKFLRYDGENLAEIDISASVPTFLLYLLSNLQDSTIHIDKIIKNKYYYNHYMLVKNAVSIDLTEINEIKTNMLNDTLYCRFLDELINYNVLDDTYHQWQFNEYYFPECSFINYDKNPNLKNNLNKALAKKAFLSMLNSKNGTFKLEETSFKYLYPTIYNFLINIKSKKHKRFSHLILQTESYFMLNIIARGLNNKFRKKIPILTLHDCIITTESNFNDVKHFMERTFERELGFIPNMKSNPWI